MSITSRSNHFAHLSWPNASNAGQIEGSTLIWPFGACEQHGPHLPLITDSYFAETVIEKVIEKLNPSFPIWLLPTQAIGFSPEHSSFPGTLTLSAGLLLQLVIEVGEQLAKIGFNRLLLFNAHGGQIGLLESAARELRLKCPSMAVLPCFLWRGVNDLDDLIPESEKKLGLHAGLAETSLMLSLNSNLVGDPRNIDGEHSSSKSLATPPPGWSLEGAAPYAWLTKDLSDSGVIGDNRESSIELGKAIQNALISHWVKQLTNLMESKWPPIKD